MTSTNTNVFRKRHNLAAWIMQFICATIYLAFGLYYIIKDATDTDTYFGPSASIDGIVNTILSLITIGLNIGEVVTFAKGRLNPVFLLVSAVIKTAIWGAIFFMLLVAMGVIGGFVLPLHFVVLLLLFGSSISQLVIGAMFVHKKRNGTLVPVGGAGVETRKESV